ncbi:MAG: GldG family protein [Treponema sp.]|nr:GldG family protein [Treponema sp.]
MTRKQQGVIVTVLSVGIMILLLLVSGRIWRRLDISSGRASTLSPVSRNLYREITETVRITYYCSGKLQSIDPAPGEISDLLKEYAARSRGKILVTFRDPSGGFSRDAERFGLMPQSLPNVGSDELSLTTVYSGIVIEYLNRAEVVPWIFGIDTLEYDITSRIRSLAAGNSRELGILAPDPRKDLSEYYGPLNQILSQSGFSVLPLYPGDEIPDTLPALFVLGGVETLDRYSLYHIDRYIQLGGRVLFSVESVDVDFAYNWDARLMQDRGLLSMISFYGATVGQSVVMDPASLELSYRDSSGRPVMQRYPFWVAVQEENGNRDSIVTSGFGGADLFWASPLTFTLPESGAVTGEVLFSSSPQAFLMTKDFLVRPDSGYAFAAEETETKGGKILAVSLAGIFPGWFSGLEKPDEEGRPPLPDMPSRPKESRIIVVGDSDAAGIITQYTYSQSMRNFEFMRKAADWLRNDDDVVGIRNRQSGAGRLDRIADPAERLGTMRFARILNVVFIPLGIIIFGILRAFKRRPGKEQRNG